MCSRLVLEVLGSWVGVGLVGVAISGPEFALFSYILSSVGITLVQLPWQQLSVLNLQQLVLEVA